MNELKGNTFPFTFFFVRYDNSKVQSDPNNSSRDIVVMSHDSSIAVTFMSNLMGNDHNTFLISLDSGIPSPRLNKSLAISRNLALY